MTMHLPLQDIAKIYFTLQICSVSFQCMSVAEVWRANGDVSERAGDGVEEPGVAHHSQ